VNIFQYTDAPSNSTEQRHYTSNENILKYLPGEPALHSDAVQRSRSQEKRCSPVAAPQKTKDKINCFSISTDHGLCYRSRTNRAVDSVKEMSLQRSSSAS